MFVGGDLVFRRNSGHLRPVVAVFVEVDRAVFARYRRRRRFRLAGGGGREFRYPGFIFDDVVDDVVDDVADDVVDDNGHFRHLRKTCAPFRPRCEESQWRLQTVRFQRRFFLMGHTNRRRSIPFHSIQFNSISSTTSIKESQRIAKNLYRNEESGEMLISLWGRRGGELTWSASASPKF